MVLEFQPSIYIVSEDVGVVALTIVKRAETTRNITVHFFTKDESASCKIIHNLNVCCLHTFTCVKK